MHHKKRAVQALFLRYGGDGGSRTHVQKYFRRTFSERSQCFVIRRIRRDADTLRNCYPVSPLKYQELSQRFPAFMTPDFKPAGEPEAARGAELCSQCEIVVIFSVYIYRPLFTWTGRHGSLILVPHSCRNHYIPGMCDGCHTIFLL